MVSTCHLSVSTFAPNTVLALGLSSYAAAKGFSPTNANQYCIYTIYESFSSLKWQDTINATSAKSGEDLCAYNGASLMRLDAIEAEATTEYIEQLPFLNPNTETQAKIARTADDTISLNIAWGVHGYWAFVVLVGMVSNSLTWLFHGRVTGQPQDTEKPRSHLQFRHRSNPVCRIFDAVNTYLNLSPSLGTYHQRLWYGCKVLLPLQALAIWATGWVFHTFNLFNRHLARVTVIYAIFHSISYTVKYLAYYLQTDWFCFGIVATVLISLMILISCAALRKRFYELFLIVHIIFGIVIVYALFTFDRLLRLVRLAICNLRIKHSDAIHPTDRSTITYYHESDLLQMEIQPSSLPILPKAGHYFHLYQPATLRRWENHPFTMSSFRGGCTLAPQHRLKTQCFNAGGTFHPTLLLEGPYGRHEELGSSFSNIVMIMCGTGISVATAYLRDLVLGDDVPAVQIELHWTVREVALVREVCYAELREFLDRPDVKVRFYCLRGGVGSLVTGAAEGVHGVKDGRAPIARIVGGAAARAREDCCPVAVLVYGPAGMADACRAAVCEARRGGYRMEYLEEAYGWQNSGYGGLKGV
ncbi:ferric reductase family protein [Aspergillus homomorphus CBS 101889]|uniref:Ferric oxidoreductase domain-containing protein n=1 Tax=Aspergillus homomorphus (strain CBS 101889) TaxID=1450537 RepID=A0A395I0H3_ASPHC|nr:hypothetical protein BO97DRAFT_469907 [Aspergillus homomorphus CBS 101889]RAL13179.1 hypothetical protein BO97DRAFT_469907 [Aspergillus homomorphus CBS 101889]